MDSVFENALESLYPRLVLLEALTDSKIRHEPRPTSTDPVEKARRAFMDSFAYLCDIAKGGKTVTAVGLQKLAVSNFLWIAANEGIRWEVKHFAEWMRSSLMAMTPQTEREVHESIFNNAIKIGLPRLDDYRGEVRRFATRCRMTLKRDLPDATGEIQCYCSIRQPFPNLFQQNLSARV